MANRGLRPSFAINQAIYDSPSEITVNWHLVLVIAWFGGQLRINFLSKILKFFVIARAFRFDITFNTIQGEKGSFADSINRTETD